MMGPLFFFGSVVANRLKSSAARKKEGAELTNRAIENPLNQPNLVERAVRLIEEAFTMIGQSSASTAADVADVAARGATDVTLVGLSSNTGIQAIQVPARALPDQRAVLLDAMQRAPALWMAILTTPRLGRQILNAAQSRTPRNFIPWLIHEVGQEIHMPEQQPPGDVAVDNDILPDLNQLLDDANAPVIDLMRATEDVRQILNLPIPEVLNRLGVQQPIDPMRLWENDDTQRAFQQALNSVESPIVQAILRMQPSDRIVVRMTNPEGAQTTTVISPRMLLNRPNILIAFLNELFLSHNISIEVLPKAVVQAQRRGVHSVQSAARLSDSVSANIPPVLSNAQMLERIRIAALVRSIEGTPSIGHGVTPNKAPKQPRVRIARPLGAAGASHEEEEEFQQFSSAFEASSAEFSTEIPASEVVSTPSITVEPKTPKAQFKTKVRASKRGDNMAKNKSKQTEVDISTFVQPTKTAKKPTQSTSVNLTAQTFNELSHTLEAINQRIKQENELDQITDLIHKASDAINNAHTRGQITTAQHTQLIVHLGSLKKALNNIHQPPYQEVLPPSDGVNDQDPTNNLKEAIETDINKARNENPVEGLKILQEARAKIAYFRAENNLTTKTFQTHNVEPKLMNLLSDIGVAERHLNQQIDLKRKVKERVRGHVAAAVQSVENTNTPGVFTEVVTQLVTQDRDKVAGLLNDIIPRMLQLGEGQEYLQIEGQSSESTLTTQQRRKEISALIQQKCENAIANGADSELVESVQNALMTVSELMYGAQNGATVLMIPYTAQTRVVMNYINLQQRDLSGVLANLLARMVLDGYQGRFVAHLVTEQQASVMQMALNSLPEQGGQLSMSQIQGLINRVMIQDLARAKDLKFTITDSDLSAVVAKDDFEALSRTQAHSAISTEALMRMLLVALFALNRVYNDAELKVAVQQQSEPEAVSEVVESKPAGHAAPEPAGHAPELTELAIPVSHTLSPAKQQPTGMSPVKRAPVREPEEHPLNAKLVERTPTPSAKIARESNQEMIDGYMQELADLIIQIQALDRKKGLNDDHKKEIGKLANELHKQMMIFLDKPSNDKFTVFKLNCEKAIHAAENQFKKEGVVWDLIKPVLNMFIAALNNIKALIFRQPKQYSIFKSVAEEIWENSNLKDGLRVLQAKMKSFDFEGETGLETKETQANLRK